MKLNKVACFVLFNVQVTDVIDGEDEEEAPPCMQLEGNG